MIVLAVFPGLIPDANFLLQAQGIAAPPYNPVGYVEPLNGTPAAPNWPGPWNSSYDYNVSASTNSTIGPQPGVVRPFYFDCDVWDGGCGGEGGGEPQVSIYFNSFQGSSVLCFLPATGSTCLRWVHQYQLIYA